MGAKSPSWIRNPAGALAPHPVVKFAQKVLRLDNSSAITARAKYLLAPDGERLPSQKLTLAIATVRMKCSRAAYVGQNILCEYSMDALAAARWKWQLPRMLAAFMRSESVRWMAEQTTFLKWK